jgi:acyl carrier protein phosphodiesterase
MYFDHLLAKNFENHTNKSLGLFAENVYEVYTDYEALMPEKSSRFLSYVIKNNIYMTYAEIEGIEQVLKHLSRRLNHNVALNDSLNLFLAAEEELQNNFDVFFTALKAEFL